MKTPHLKLLTLSDTEAFHQLINRNKTILQRYFPITVSLNETLADTEKYIIDRLTKVEAKEFYPLGIFDDKALIGMVLVKSIDWRIPKGELGYYLDQSYYGKGLMSKAIAQTLTYCFETLKMRKVFLRINPDNIGSIRIAEKNGFILEGTLRAEFRIDTGEIVDVNYYGKLMSDT